MMGVNFRLVWIGATLLLATFNLQASMVSGPLITGSLQEVSVTGDAVRIGGHVYSVSPKTTLVGVKKLGDLVPGTNVTVILAPGQNRIQRLIVEVPARRVRGHR